MQSMLFVMGFKSNIVGTGQLGLAALDTEHYDAILMDCLIPLMAGYELTKRSRTIPGERSPTPIIALTSNTTIENQWRCLETGIDDYLPKPVIMAELKQIIDKWTLSPTNRLELENH